MLLVGKDAFLTLDLGLDIVRHIDSEFASITAKSLDK